MARAHRAIGKPMKRKEDPRLLQGIARYVDDLRLPGMHYLAFVRRPHAHARIISIDTSAAKSAPGVLAVFTGEDLRGSIGTVPCAAVIPDMKAAPRPVLALDKVRMVGEAVAVVVAADRYGARDAADLVEVDYEPLTAVVDMEKAITRDSPVIHEQYQDNIAYRWQLEGGDLKKAFAQADQVVKQRIVNQRLIPVAMEPRGTVAEFLPGENLLKVWSSTQIPHLLRTQIAGMVGVSETSVQVITPEVGGGFGSKLNVYPEEALTAHLAMRLGKPMKWIETRRENFLVAIHGRDQIDDVEFAVKQDGTLLGLKV